MSSKEWIRWLTEKPIFKKYSADEIELLHSDLTGIGADDHHAKQHAISSGTDHTGLLVMGQLPAALEEYIAGIAMIMGG